MKKFFALLGVLFVMGTTSVFALGIGVQGGYPLGGALTFKLDNKAPVFALTVENNGFGLTADWWFGNKTFAAPFGYFYGVGAGGSYHGGSNWAYLTLYPRLFGGLNCFIIDNHLELYLQAAYQPTFILGLNNYEIANPFDFISWGVAVGFRFWL